MPNSFSLLNEDIQACIRERNFEPTPIQEKAIPEIINDRNPLIIAPTGTGKTEAAILPVFHNYMKQKVKEPIAIIYITPLRALNRDMLERITWWGDKLGPEVSVRHGDTSQTERSKQLKHPPDLLITTPESLGSILTAPKMGDHLINVRYVIIDEVHELVEDKRGAQLAVALERLALRSGGFQRIGLSATIGDPEKVAKFFKLDTIVRDEDTERKLKVTVECPRYSKDDIALSDKLQVPPDVVARLRRLKDLVDERKAVLTFVNTRTMAELLSSRFEAWDKAHHIGVHHSSLSRDVRVVAEKKFKDGTIKGLIATSSLELGIDIGKIDLVVQYTSPRQVCRLIQRVGRSGHTIYRFPEGVVITSDPEDVLEASVIARNALDGKLEGISTFEKPLDVLAQQIVGITLELGRQKISEAFELVKKAYPFRDLTIDEFISVVQQLVAERILWTEGNEFGKKKPAYLYYYGNLSMIPDETKFFVMDSTSGKNIAVLDEAFVVNNLSPGSLFITRGTPWNVVDITEREVIVQPAYDISGAIPAWEGEQIPVPYEIAQEVGRLRKKILEEGFDFTKYCMDSSAYIEALTLSKKQKDYFIPDDKTIWFEAVDNFLIIYAHFGSVVNETLGKMVSILVSAYLGETVGMKSDPYRLILEFTKSSQPELVKKVLLETKPETVKTILERSLLRTTLFRYKFIQVAKRFGLVEKFHDYQKINIRRLIEAVLDSPIYQETLNEIFKEKLDVEKTKEVLSDMQSGKIKINEYNGKMSPLTQHTLDRIMKVPELILPARPESEIIEIMKTRIYDKRAKLICTYCSSIFYDMVKDLPKKIKCPSCGSTMVTFSKSDEDVKALLEKKKQSKKLDDEEEKKLKEYEHIATLINAYGKQAVIVLSGRGVGPEVATRVLGRRRQTEKGLFKDMLEEQKKFLATKRYWT